MRPQATLDSSRRDPMRGSTHRTRAVVAVGCPKGWCGDSAIALTSPGHWLPWGRFSVAVRTGRRQTVETLGADLFEYYSDNPAEGRAFTGAMSVSGMEVAGEVARVLDTSSANLWWTSVERPAH